MPGTSSSGGRNKKSLAQHDLAGTGRMDRGTKPAAGVTPDPTPPLGRPIRPSTLRGHASVEWTRMVDRLEASQTLSTVDDAVLYQYVQLFAETEGILESRRTNARLAKTLYAAIDRLVAAYERAEGADPDASVLNITKAVAQIVELKKLDAKHITQLRQGHMALRQYLVEFGMTPAARSRVTAAPPPAPIDPFAEFAPQGLMQ